MKKIVFVEKEDNTSYDPVSTFIANRKSNSAMKPPPPSTKKPIEKKITESKTMIKDKISTTQKIGKKGDHLPPRNNEMKKK